MDPQNFFKNLNTIKESKEVENQLSTLHHVLTHEQLEGSLLNEFLLNFFNKNYGLTTFMKNAANNKEYSKCLPICFDIIYVLINNISEKIKIHISFIFQICITIIKSQQTSALERKRAYEVLTISFEKIPMDLEVMESYNTIYDWFLSCLRFEKANSVLEKLLIALGKFGCNCQHAVKDPVIVKKQFLSRTLLSKSIPDSVVCGAFMGLLDFCCSFPLDAQDDTNMIETLYKNIKTLINKTSEAKSATRAALIFFAKYVNLFGKFLIDDSPQWIKVTKKWLESENGEDYKVGLQLSLSFYRGVAKILSEADNSIDANKIITLRFKKYFLKMLSENVHQTYERRLALEGLTKFAEAFYKQLSAEEVSEVKILLIQSLEKNYVFSKCGTEDLEFLPQYIKAFSKYLQFQNIETVHLCSLQRAITLMIKSFPFLHYSYSNYAIESILLIFYQMKTLEKSIYDDFVATAIYHGVVWTCSNKHISEETMFDDSKQVITIKNYSNLWSGLLKIDTNYKFDNERVYLKDRKEILVKITESLVKTLLTLTNKLNVSVLSNEENATDMKSAYKVAAENDFAIFLNIIDFYEEIMNNIDPLILNKFIIKLIHHFVGKCLKYPLISGFYKLLRSCIKICKNLDYFTVNNMDIDSEICSCIQTLRQFVDVLLVKIEQFTDELLISCLQLLLEYPVLLIKDVLHACIPSFITLITAGRNYIKLVDEAVDTLEIWQKELPSEEFNSFLEKIISHFDFFLRSNSLNGMSIGSVEKRRKTDRVLKKRKIIVEIEPELLSLQNKILHFLGSQSCKMCDEFVNGNNKIDLAVWGNQQHLKVLFSYNDVKIDFYLDRIMPRIIELSLNSADKKVKVASCELLHAMVMIFLGTTKQMTRSVNSDLNNLFKHLSMPLLKLGCDFNPVVRQLFEPLFFQLIHWYTYKNQTRSDHEAIIIETMMEGISNPTDSTVRDFSGKCLNEFVKWTIKQNTEEALSNDPINIKVLTKRIRFYSSHPDLYKKLGAALIFNYIYKELREERTLFSMFWIEYLHIFVKSLSMLDNLTKNENVILQLKNAITHLQRGFVEKSRIFNDVDRKRKLPLDIQCGTLTEVTVWILLQSGSKNSVCRATCMDFFTKSAPFTPGFKNYASFINENLANKNSNWIRDLYLNLMHSNIPDFSTESYDYAVLIKWLQNLLCALDGYNFIIKNDLVVFVTSEDLKPIINSFLKFISTDKSLFLQGERSITIFQREEFNIYKSEIVLKLIHLFNNYFTKNMSLNSYYSSDLWNFLVKLIFQPEVLGFDTILNFETRCQEIFNVLCIFVRKIPQRQLKYLLQEIELYLNDNYSVNNNLKGFYTYKEINIIRGLLLLQKCEIPELNLERLYTGTICNLCHELVKNEKLTVEDFTQNVIQYLNDVLRFALYYNGEFEELTKVLITSNRVLKLSGEQIQFSAFLFETFENVLTDFIAKKFHRFMDIVNSSTHDVYLLIDLIYNILKCMEKDIQMKTVSELVIKCILSYWSQFETYFNLSLYNSYKGLDLVETMFVLVQKQKFETKDVIYWLTNLLEIEQGDIQERFEFHMKVVSVMVKLILEETETVNLSSSLNLLSELYFSQNSTLTENAKIMGLDRLIALIPKVKNSKLFGFIMSNYALVLSYVEETSELKDDIFSNTFCTKAMLYEVHQLFDIRKKQHYFLSKQVILLFYHCNDVVFEEFFIEAVSKILSTLQQETNSDNINAKIFNFMLIELFFSRCPMNKLDVNVSRVTEAVGLTHNKFLFLKFLQISFATAKDNANLDLTYKDLVRTLKCHSYNCSVSIITNCIKEKAFYYKLFVRKENEINVLWNGLIDLEKKFTFESDFQNLPKQRKVLVGIRDNLRASKTSQSNQIQYLESMRIYNSSLSEDFTKFDFTESIVRSQELTLADKDVKQKVDNSTSEIYLDLIDVNMHESMATVCCLISHISQLEDVKNSCESELNTLPEFLQGIRELLLDSTTHVNVKIFWIKIIDNKADFFQKYAKYFMESLLKFIVDNCAGTDLNYFVTDTISLLASWSSIYLPENGEIILVNRLFEFLIKNLSNERLDKFKYHLELIKLIVEAWKPILSVPHSVLLDDLSKIIAKNKQVPKQAEVTVHVSSILLCNGLLPWRSSFLELKLFDIISNTSWKSTYKPAAETLAVCLFTLHQNGSNQYQKCLDAVNDFLRSLSSSDKYGFVLDSMTLHFPQIVTTSILEMIIIKLDSAQLDIKLVYLKILLKRAEILNDVDEFKITDWIRYLKHAKFEIQLMTLELVYKTIPILKTTSQFEQVIESACALVSHSNKICRFQLFELAIKISQIETNEKLIALCLDVLVQGFMDKDQELRNQVRSFWQDSSFLPEHVTQRFSYILSNLYKTYTENDFLGYSCYLILDALHRTEEYNKKLFEHALEDCDFENYNLNVNWKMQSRSILPMFAETFQSLVEPVIGNEDNNQLRQTQDFRTFLPTQSVKFTQSQLTITESSLTVGTEQGTTFLNPNLTTISGDYKKSNKRRFLKQKGQISKILAQKQVSKLKFEEKKRINLAVERDYGVSLYRNYRIGDLPDIQISLRAILDPLQHIVLHDGETAKILYVEIFNGILSKTEFKQQFLNEVLIGIKNIFTCSQYYNLNLFRALFDILLNNKNNIKIEPDLLVNACETSGLLSIGTLIFEEYLINFDDVNDIYEPGPSKKLRIEGFSEKSSLFLQLSELYKSMDEWEVVKSIFLQKMDCNDLFKSALIAESEKDWRNAEAYYKALVQESTPSHEMKDFFFESYCKSLNYLGKWDELNSEIKKQSKETGSSCWSKLWEENWKKKKLLSLYINSHLKQYLFDGKIESLNCLLIEINEILLSENAEILKNTFAEELAILHIIKNDTNEALQFVGSYMKQFLYKWHLLDPSYSNYRLNSLIKLHNIVDIAKYIKVTSINSEEEVNSYLNDCIKSNEDVLPSILLTETRMLYQKQFITMLKRKLNEDEEFDEVIENMNSFTKTLYSNIITAAISDNNFYIARKYLTLCQNEPYLKLLLTRTRHITVPFMNDDADKQVDILIKCCTELVHLENKEITKFQKLTTYVYLFKYTEELSQILNEKNDLFKKYVHTIAQITDDTIQKETDISDFAAQKLKLHLQIYDLEENMDEERRYKQNNELQVIMEAYLKLAYYAKKREDTSNFTLLVLRAVKFDSLEAKQLFPCILTTSLSFDDTNIFIKECKDISSWIFLDWIPQILTNIYLDNVDAIENLIIRIAKSYPQAVMYSYRLCKRADCPNLKAQSLCDKLDVILCNNQIVDLFLKALSFVSIPFTSLLYFIRRLGIFCNMEDRHMIDVIFNEINALFEKSNYGNTDSLQGALYDKIDKYFSQLVKIKDQTFVTMKNSLKEIHSNIDAEQKSMFKMKTLTFLLRDLSPWLAYFSTHQGDMDLEIPGQYDSKKLSRNQYHINIFGFSPNVLVMNSLRRPIKLTILGHDGKEYPFLIKFGEDLRQDQRIQQLFTLMNDIMATDSTRISSIQKFKVVPLTPKLGMIQWIENTQKFSDFIFNNSNDIYQKTAAQYTKFIQGNYPALTSEVYHSVIMNYTKVKVVSFYNYLISTMSSDLLKTSLWKLSSNTESYCTLRNTFIKSYAVLCASNWILGIGDRHLENFLLNVNNGSVLGIDFGHAFGTATQILPVPELIPFRLTPQIVNLMEPLGEKGIFRETIIKFLRLMRQKADCLIATMNVFIEEPLLDWLEHPLRYSENTRITSDVNWYPKSKILQAKRKLLGASSSTIIIEELQAGHGHLHCIDAYIQLVQGNLDDNFRASKINENLSVEDQVDVLIDHATDRNLLGRMYVGWAPWV